MPSTMMSRACAASSIGRWLISKMPLPNLHLVIHARCVSSRSRDCNFSSHV
jgi:hypothetical protein